VVTSSLPKEEGGTEEGGTEEGGTEEGGTEEGGTEEGGSDMWLSTAPLLPGWLASCPTKSTRNSAVASGGARPLSMRAGG
jgi:hypothetical protein